MRWHLWRQGRKCTISIGCKRSFCFEGSAMEISRESDNQMECQGWLGRTEYSEEIRTISQVLNTNIHQQHSQIFKPEMELYFSSGMVPEQP